MSEFDIEQYRSHIESLDLLLGAIPDSRLTLEGQNELMESTSTYPFSRPFPDSTLCAVSYSSSVPRSAESLQELILGKERYQLLELGIYTPRQGMEANFDTTRYIARAFHDLNGVFVNATHICEGKIQREASIMSPNALDRFFRTMRVALYETFPSLEELL